MAARKSIKDKKLDFVAEEMAVAAFGESMPMQRHKSTTSLSLANDFRNHRNNQQKLNGQSSDGNSQMCLSPTPSHDGRGRQFGNLDSMKSPSSARLMPNGTPKGSSPEAKFEATSTWTPGSYRRRVSHVFKKTPSQAEDVDAPSPNVAYQKMRSETTAKLVKISEPINEVEEEHDSKAQEILSESYPTTQFSDSTEESSSSSEELSPISPVQVRKEELEKRSSKEMDAVKIEEFLRNAQVENMDINGRIEKKKMFGKRHMYPLHYAVKKNRLDMVKLLVARGADVTLKDCKGRTAEQVAKKSRKNNSVAFVSALKGKTA